MAEPRKRSGRALGVDEGPERGPRDGEGATIHQQSGEMDFDGTPGDELPPAKRTTDDLPYPPERAED